jgi:hypothetical protein
MRGVRAWSSVTAAARYAGRSVEQHLVRFVIFVFFVVESSVLSVVSVAG